MVDTKTKPLSPIKKNLKIASDMPVPTAQGDTEVVKHYKDRETFRAVSLYKGPNEVKVEELTFKRNKMYVKIKY